MLSKWFFMHLMATCFPDFIDWAFKTSEKVPSPFFEISRYLCMTIKWCLLQRECLWCWYVNTACGLQVLPLPARTVRARMQC
mmetsp:Transcript_41496/g.96543  ORF Transcript_41496/g.96543 Transcript_41496/m.96543 type:complete len:82 (-) Transcript_41496:2-247(-)